MRLIDADAWKPWYNDVKINLEVYNQYADGYEDAIDNVDDWMDAQPIIDAVPVVRCKDCVRRYDPNLCPMCTLIEGAYNEYTNGNGYCDRGERKDHD